MMARHPTRLIACIATAAAAMGFLLQCTGERSVSFRLEKTTIDLGEEPVVVLDAPFRNKEGSTFWLTVEDPGNYHGYDHRPSSLPVKRK
jgi:hypothetical protein